METNTVGIKEIEIAREIIYVDISRSTFSIPRILNKLNEFLGIDDIGYFTIFDREGFDNNCVEIQFRLVEKGYCMNFKVDVDIKPHTDLTVITLYALCKDEVHEIRINELKFELKIS